MRHLPSLLVLFSLIGSVGPVAKAADITTNEIAMHGAPTWVTQARVDKVVAGIQSKLEWDIHKINVYWYGDEYSFERSCGLGAGVLAFSRRQDQTVHVGPRVTTADFDSVFGHELVHIILYQKYKDSIPSWLDEGLANFVSKHGTVDYKWLASEPPGDVHMLAHPFTPVYSGGIAVAPPTPERVRFCYEASTAVMEMITSKCALADILQLSLGSKLENYLSTLCGITDLNGEFRAWVLKKAKSQ